MKVLLLYYSFTGQARRAVEAVQDECRSAGWLPVLCRVEFAAEEMRLRRPLSVGDIKRWTDAARRGEKLPVAYDPPQALQDRYDLVCIFSNTWQKSPSVPIRSFLESPDAARLLAGKPFAVYVVCRRLWENNLAVVRRLGEAAGGRFVDGVSLAHNGGPISSLIQTTTYMMGSGQGWKRFAGVPLPSYGLSQASVEKIAPFTRGVLERADTHRLRIVPLQGGHNFRDLGGYPTASGGRVRSGLVYRSGSLAELTPEDQQRIARLGIMVVCDFRSNHERESRPSRWPDRSVIELWTRDHETSVGDLIEALREPGASAAAIRHRMIASYRTLPYEQADSYRALFQRIAAGRLPLVFHCSAGKDRTGIAAALLLSILGVPRDTVIDDYVLTERFHEGLCRLVLADPTAARYRHVDREIWEPMLRAERAYLETAFETLEQAHGSVAGYLRDVLGIDDAMQATLRSKLVE